MTASIHRSIRESIRSELSANELWLAEDRGLIKCWELGRTMMKTRPTVAERAQNGELPALTWKGGTDQELKIPVKWGSFRYLATWQGLRGEDLDIDLTREIEMICSRTGLKVIYTPDPTKYSTP